MNQRYSITIDVGADISKARAAMGDLQKIFNTQNLGAGQSNRLASMFIDLSKALDELENKSGKTFSSLGEIRGIDKAKDKVSSLIDDIAREFNKLEGMGDTELGKNFKGLADNLAKAGEAFKTYESSMSKIKNRQNELSKYIEKTTKEYEKQKQVQKAYRDFRKDLPEEARGKQQAGVRAYLNNQLDIAQKENKKRQEELNDYINSKGLGADVITKTGSVRKNQEYSDDETLNKLASNAKEAQSALDGCTKSLNDFNNITKNLKSENEFKKIGDSLKQAQEELANLTSGKLSEDAFNNLKTSLSSVFGEELFKDIQNSENAVDQFKEKINSISADKLNSLKQQFPEIISLLEKMGTAARGAGQKINEGLGTATKAEQMGKEIDVLGSRLKYFFSLAGGFNLMRRAIRSAVTTTKELDAVMTQTAVVSEYTVGDMWKMLPQYSKEAKRLGAVIKDVYSAQTLYVQQGLNMNDAMDLGVETLKMARVAGIGAEEATNSMTAALRGFNMELNESSAVRINDVYSKLAQNTASNVQEISTAMTKTAALANSANMSFENTAAFLATIIESTREGAETAGTALKTVIARFTEVKKLYDEGELTGTDEEGQEVDVNKISKALRTAGINMNDFFTGAKGLDEIFMELGSKWDSLTTVQQRYIATMAAGSRQQSRFLALMQNYSRTVELTQMAYNSAGSGQEQFEKTLDSLEAKINKFKDTWDTFIMGIANSDLIKGAIDFGTDFLEILNNIVNAISGSNGLIKSITSIGLAVGGFKIARSVFGGGGLLSSIISGKGLKVGEQYGKTFTKGLTYALSKQGRQEGYGLGNWAYQAFKVNKTGYLDGITKENAASIEQAYKDYDQRINEINLKRQEQKYSDTLSQQKFDRDTVQERKSFQEKTGLNEKQAQTVIDNKGVQQTVKDYNALGNAALLAGTAIFTVTAALQSSGAIGEKTGGIFKSLGAGLMAMGGAVKIITAIGGAFASWAGPIGIAIGLITTLYGVYDALNESPTEKFDRLSEESEKISQTVEKLEGKIGDLESKFSSITEQEDAFSDLILGTEEWDTAVQNLNQSILELVRLYPELADAVEFVGGRWQLDIDKYQKFLDDQKDFLSRTQLIESAGELVTAQAEYEKDTTHGVGRQIREGTYLENFKDEASFIAVDDDYRTDLKINEEEGSTIYRNLLNGTYDKIIEEIYNALLEGSLSLTDDLEKNIKAIGIRFNNSSFGTLGSQRVIAQLFTENAEAFETARKYNRAAEKAQAVTRSQAIINGYQQTAASKDTQYSQFFSEYAGALYDSFITTLSEGAIAEGQKEIEQDYLSKHKVTLKDALIAEFGEIDDTWYEEYIKNQVAINSFIEKINESYNNFIQSAEKTPELTSFLSEGFKGLKVDTTPDKFVEQLRQIGIEDDLIAKIFGFDSYEEFSAGWEDFIGKINTNQYKSLLPTKDLTYGQVEGLNTLYSGVKIRGGNLEETSKIINEDILPQAKTDNLQDVLNLITGTDFSSITNIDNFIKSLEELGIVLSKDVITNLKEATKATYRYSKQSADTALTNAEKTKAAIEKVQSGESLTQDEISLIDAAFGETYRKQNFARYGEDDYRYVVENVNDIVDKFNEYVVNTIQNELKSVSESVEAGQKVRDGLNDVQKTLIETILTSTEEEFKNIEPGKLDEALSSLGLTPSEYTTNEEKRAALEYAYSPYGVQGANLATAEELQQQLINEQTRGYNQIISAQTLLDQISAGDEAARQVLESRVKELGTGEKYMVSKDTVELGKEYEDVLNALAIDSNKAAKGFDNLTQAYKENADALKAENKGTREYGIALANLTKSVKAAFGNNDKITEDFVDNNLNLFKDYAEGAEGAEDRIRQAMMDEGIANIAIQNLDDLQKAIDSIDGSQLTINGTADCSQAFSELANVVGSAEEAAAAMESLGYSVTWEATGTIVDEHGQSYTNYRAVVSDNVGKAVNRNRAGGGGGGGGGSKEFKNDFDKYYNQVEDINELERQRNLLEKDYDQLLKSESKSGKDIYDNLSKQLALLRERASLTADLAEKRKQQIIDTTQDEEYKDVAKYAWWNEADLTIEIDWDAINQIKDSEQGDLVKEYVKKLEDFQSKYDDMIENLEDIESTIQEINERGKEEYTSLEDRTRDALIKQIQDKIDELSDVNESINDTNQKLFDSINETLQLQRQERTNAETEEELSDKEKRLAYLQQDSSNANQVEIAKLQEEIDDARQDYTDNLIDQKISELQRQNDEAANQRQQQIELMQRSLDWEEKSGAFWQEVYRLISEGTDATGQLVRASELEQLLKQGEAWDSLSLEGQMGWLEKLEDEVAQGVAYLEMQRQLESIGTKEGAQISFTNASGQTLSGTVDKNGNVVVKNADGSTTTYKDVFQDYHGAYRTFEGEGETKVAQKSTTTTSPTPTKTSSDDKEPQVEVEYSYESAGDTSHWIYKRNKGTMKWYRIGMEAHTGTTSCSKCGWKKQNNNSSGGGGGGSNRVMMKYATGGLNTQTGPAWLDGTKSSPELVLNARDTQNFIELKDTLASIKSGNGLNLTGGDNYYDIKVQVDSLGSDYDVDKAIDRIKARIAQDGAYRNVNTLSRLR